MNVKRIPVLVYHAVHPDPSLISISPGTFSRQMAWLSQHGYHAIALSHLIDHLRNGKRIPSNAIVLTFDDGYACLHDYVFPVLVRHGFLATIFLVTGYCGRQNDWPGQPASIPRMTLLNWDQIREMDDYGIEIGAHTANHPMLDQLNSNEMKNEILGSKETIETELRHKIRTFSYPYGRLNEMVKGIVKTEFSGACSTRVGLVNPTSDLFEIERVDINYIKNHRIFRSLESSYFSPYLYMRRSLRRISRLIYNRTWW